MPILTLSSSLYSSLAQEKFPVREWTFRVPGLADHVSFNPLVSGIGIAALWGLAIWSMVVSLLLVHIDSHRNMERSLLARHYTALLSSFALNGLDTPQKESKETYV
jgi:hypothetical protein